MTLPQEGHLASYVGDGQRDGVSLGAQGEVLSLERTAAYIKWLTGSRAGMVTLTDRDDLVPVEEMAHTGAVRHEAFYGDDLDDSLEMGSLVATGAAELPPGQDAAGVLTMLASQGHLRGLAGLADEALSVVSHRVRHDPAIQEVTAQLDHDEAEELVRLTAVSLLSDAFGSRQS